MDLRKIIPGVFTVVGVILKVVFDIQIDKEKLDNRLGKYDEYMIKSTEKRLDLIEQKIIGTGEQPEETEKEEAPE